MRSTGFVFNLQLTGVSQYDLTTVLFYGEALELNLQKYTGISS